MVNSQLRYPSSPDFSAMQNNYFSFLHIPEEKPLAAAQIERRNDYTFRYAPHNPQWNNFAAFA